MSELTFDGVMELFRAQQTVPFPVYFDKGWEWLGYSRKDNAKAALFGAGFIQGIDFLINQEALDQGFQPLTANKENIRLTIDCFKQWGMMAGTEQGKQIRRYFLECERIAKKMAMEEPKSEFWQLIDNAIARGIDLESAIDLHHRFQVPTLTPPSPEPPAQPQPQPEPPEPQEMIRITKNISVPKAEAMRFIQETGVLQDGNTAEVRDIWKKLEPWQKQNGILLAPSSQHIYNLLKDCVPYLIRDKAPATRRTFLRMAIPRPSVL